ncbi:hypothetical protein C8Q73DRAFT_153760 [Cubamyces lactineus]|nr:hypothetical protein C8Q73DRAFT_153760 [Cubamyces lactineus]
MLEYWDKDGFRMAENQQKSEIESASQRSPNALTTRADVLPEPLATFGGGPSRHNSGLQSAIVRGDVDGLSMRSSSTTTSEGRSMCSLDDIAAMNIFSGPNDDVDVIPLADLWISELAEHLKQEDIPSPHEMFAKFDHIAKIVQQARIRSYAALTAPGHVSQEDTDSAPEYVLRSASSESGSLGIVENCAHILNDFPPNSRGCCALLTFRSGPDPVCVNISVHTLRYPNLSNKRSSCLRHQ